MKLIFFIPVLISSILNGCAQNINSDEFKGRIYMLESQEVFFQLEASGIASYYSIEEMGERNISKHKAIWKISKDTTLLLNVIYKMENVEFVLKYNKEKDYWIDSDSISAFRRMKHVKYKEYELTEF